MQCNKSSKVVFTSTSVRAAHAGSTRYTIRLTEIAGGSAKFSEHAYKTRGFGARLVVLCYANLYNSQRGALTNTVVRPKWQFIIESTNTVVRLVILTIVAATV